VQLVGNVQYTPALNTTAARHTKYTPAAAAVLAIHHQNRVPQVGDAKPTSQSVQLGVENHQNWHLHALGNISHRYYYGY
jgi:hypothetical protein